MRKNNQFKLNSPFKPAGDQPVAISQLVDGLGKKMDKQTLLGATGTGKTFTIANVIEQVQKPTLVIAHNKTLAAQLAQEFRELFPTHAVHYFVSYYDYYQPEAYMPVTDTYIEKDAQINDEIDRLRHASTQALLTRNDVIIVASVSCIYGLGAPKEYEKSHVFLHAGQKISRRDLMQHLISVQYSRTTADLKPGTFRSLGNKVEIMPISQKIMYQVNFDGNVIESLVEIDPVTSVITANPDDFVIFPAKHFLMDADKKDIALKKIEDELKDQLKKLEDDGKLLEAERLKRRTTYDTALIREIGYCSGIENYSRHLSGKSAGEPPETLLSYFPRDKKGRPEFLTVIDESHVTLPQLRGMYKADQSRKKTLVEFGFRLPSAIDNRPLQYEEFLERTGETIYVSATPKDYEKTESGQVVEQIIRPTGLVDPQLDVVPVSPTDDYVGQIQHFIQQAEYEIEKGGRVLATTLTKKMAEDLTDYLKEKGIKTEYIHSDIKTLERIEILTEFRRGTFDCLVGVNLLREGLDMPEVSFIGILDADKEGFLRSDTALIQTIGRAARNVDGRVILYADNVTGSMQRAIDETTRRRDKQLAHNKKHKITPQTIKKSIKDITEHLKSDHAKAVERELETDLAAFGGKIKKLIKYKEKMMNEAVKELDFETAAILRDEIKVLVEMVEEKEKQKEKAKAKEK